MEEKLIVVKIKDGDPLCVGKERLTKNSKYLRHLIDDLHFYEIEMDDFDPNVVGLFLVHLEDSHVTELEESQFRELHKMAVVFEVEWLKEGCRNWLFSRLDTEETEQSLNNGKSLFAIEECLFVQRKWGDKEKEMIEALLSKLDKEVASEVVSKYLEDVNELDTVQLDFMLRLNGKNTTVFLVAMLSSLENKESLDQNMKFLLQHIDLPLCCSQNQDLYDQLFDKLHGLKDVMNEDLRLMFKLFMDTARLIRSKSVEGVESVLSVSNPTATDNLILIKPKVITRVPQP